MFVRATSPYIIYWIVCFKRALAKGLVALADPTKRLAFHR